MICDICKQEIKSLDDLRILPRRASSMVGYVCLKCYTKKISEVLKFKESERMNDELTNRLNGNIKYMQENYCTNFIGCKDRGLNIFCLNNGIVTAIQCKECHERKVRKIHDNN